jgi:hypothetical protein
MKLPEKKGITWPQETIVAPVIVPKKSEPVGTLDDIRLMLNQVALILKEELQMTNRTSIKIVADKIQMALDLLK